VGGVRMPRLRLPRGHEPCSCCADGQHPDGTDCDRCGVLGHLRAVPGLVPQACPGQSLRVTRRHWRQPR
jgi:hypothetical protein